MVLVKRQFKTKCLASNGEYQFYDAPNAACRCTPTGSRTHRARRLQPIASPNNPINHHTLTTMRNHLLPVLLGAACMPLTTMAQTAMKPTKVKDIRTTGDPMIGTLPAMDPCVYCSMIHKDDLSIPRRCGVGWPVTP